MIETSFFEASSLDASTIDPSSIEASSSKQRRGTQIILRPNNSASWEFIKYFLLAIVALSLTIGVSFTLLGYWVILVFTVIEMAVLFSCLWYCLRRSRLQEVLWFTQDKLVLEIGIEKPTQRKEWQRFFTKILVQPAKHPWYRKQIALRHRNEEIQIGQFLDDAEKEQLLRELRRTVQYLS